MASVDFSSSEPKRFSYGTTSNDVLQPQRSKDRYYCWKRQLMVPAKAAGLVLGALFLYLSQTVLREQPCFPAPEEQTQWSWETVFALLLSQSVSVLTPCQASPSPELVWSSCYEEFECARLQLPLDWLDLSNNSTVAVAILKKAATTQVDYKGPLFVNPGGPGGSGVAMVKSQWKALQIAVGENHVCFVHKF